MKVINRWLGRTASLARPRPAPVISAPDPETLRHVDANPDANDESEKTCPHCGQVMPPEEKADPAPEPEQQAEGAGASPGSEPAGDTPTTQETPNMSTAAPKPAAADAAAPITFAQIEAMVPENVPGRDAFIIGQMKAGATPESAQAALTQHLIGAANTANANAQAAQNANLNAHGGGAGASAETLKFTERGSKSGAGTGQFKTYAEALAYYQTPAGGGMKLGAAHRHCTIEHRDLHDAWLREQRGPAKSGSDTYVDADTSLSPKPAPVG